MKGAGGKLTCILSPLLFSASVPFKTTG